MANAIQLPCGQMMMSRVRGGLTRGIGASIGGLYRQMPVVGNWRSELIGLVSW